MNTWLRSLSVILAWALSFSQAMPLTAAAELAMLRPGPTLPTLTDEEIGLRALVESGSSGHRYSQAALTASGIQLITPDTLREDWRQLAEMHSYFEQVAAARGVSVEAAPRISPPRYAWHDPDATSYAEAVASLEQFERNLHDQARARAVITEPADQAVIPAVNAIPFSRDWFPVILYGTDRAAFDEQRRQQLAKPVAPRTVPGSAAGVIGALFVVPNRPLQLSSLSSSLGINLKDLRNDARLLEEGGAVAIDRTVIGRVPGAVAGQQTFQNWVIALTPDAVTHYNALFEFLQGIKPSRVSAARRKELAPQIAAILAGRSPEAATPPSAAAPAPSDESVESAQRQLMAEQRARYVPDEQPVVEPSATTVQPRTRVALTAPAGRVGRLAIRAMLDNPERFDVVAVNGVRQGANGNGGAAQFLLEPLRDSILFDTLFGYRPFEISIGRAVVGTDAATGQTVVQGTRTTWARQPGEHPYSPGQETQAPLTDDQQKWVRDDVLAKYAAAGKTPPSVLEWVEIHHGRSNVPPTRMLVFNERKDLTKLPWDALDVDVVASTAGEKELERGFAEGHRTAGAKAVILSAPPKDKDVPQVVLGVNDEALRAAIEGHEWLVSAASCTTNGCVPLIDVVARTAKAREGRVVAGFLKTIHSFTSDQQYADAPRTGEKASRGFSALNTLRTSSGAAKSAPAILGSGSGVGPLTGVAYRVPLEDESYVTLTMELDVSLDAAAVREAFVAAAQEPRYQGILAVRQGGVSSSAVYVGSSYSSIVDLDSIQARQGADGKTYVTVGAWYDNEAGYTARFVELVRKTGEALRALSAAPLAEVAAAAPAAAAAAKKSKGKVAETPDTFHSVTMLAQELLSRVQPASTGEAVPIRIVQLPDADEEQATMARLLISELVNGMVPGLRLADIAGLGKLADAAPFLLEDSFYGAWGVTIQDLGEGRVRFSRNGTPLAEVRWLDAPTEEPAAEAREVTVSVGTDFTIRGPARTEHRPAVRNAELALADVLQAFDEGTALHDLTLVRAPRLTAELLDRAYRRQPDEEVANVAAQRNIVVRQLSEGMVGALRHAGIQAPISGTDLQVPGRTVDVASLTLFMKQPITVAEVEARLRRLQENGLVLLIERNRPVVSQQVAGVRVPVIDLDSVTVHAEREVTIDIWYDRLMLTARHVLTQAPEVAAVQPQAPVSISAEKAAGVYQAAGRPVLEPAGPLAGTAKWEGLRDAALAKPLLVAVNLDVVKDGTIKDDTKIIEALKGLDAIQAPMVFVSHNGRPQGKRSRGLSLKPVAERIQQLWPARRVLMAGDLTGPTVAEQIRALKPGDVLVLENYRFHPYAESPNTSEREALAKAIVYGTTTLGADRAQEPLFSAFINNDFASGHRPGPDAPSTRLVDFTELLPSAAGPLLKREMEGLQPARAMDREPFVLIIAGSAEKMGDKLTLLANSVAKMPNSSTLVVAGVMAYTFLQAQAELVSRHNATVALGRSPVSAAFVLAAKKVLSAAQRKNIRVILPQDHVAIQGDITQPAASRITHALASDELAVDVGPVTRADIQAAVANARLVFWNGPLGAFDRGFADGTSEIAKAASASPAETIIGGADTIAALKVALGDDYAKYFAHVSTGGGASLDYVGLPAGDDDARVAALKRSATRWQNIFEAEADIIAPGDEWPTERPEPWDGEVEPASAPTPAEIAQTQLLATVTTILFDLTGTLLTDGLRDAIQEISRQFGVSADVVRAWLQTSQEAHEFRVGKLDAQAYWSYVVDQLHQATDNGSRSPDQTFFALPVNQQQDSLRATLYDAYRELPGVSRFVEALVKRGYRVAVVSNMERERAEYLKERFPFLRDIRIITSGDVGARKPEQAFYSTALAQLEREWGTTVPPTEILYVDDEQKNHEQPTALTWHTLLIHPGGLLDASAISYLSQKDATAREVAAAPTADTGATADGDEWPADRPEPWDGDVEPASAPAPAAAPSPSADTGIVAPGDEWPVRNEAWLQRRGLVPEPAPPAPEARLLRGAGPDIYVPTRPIPAPVSPEAATSAAVEPQAGPSAELRAQIQKTVGGIAENYFVAHEPSVRSTPVPAAPASVRAPLTTVERQLLSSVLEKAADRAGLRGVSLINPDEVAMLARLEEGIGLFYQTGNREQALALLQEGGLSKTQAEVILLDIPREIGMAGGTSRRPAAASLPAAAQAVGPTAIETLLAQEVLDSRGNPTVQATVVLGDDLIASAQVPSGASTGKREALELRDGDPNRYKGKGVANAVANVQTIHQAIRGMDVFDQAAIDQRMIELDGTENKSNLGANAMLSVSLAVPRAAAKAKHEPLYRYLGGEDAVTLPMPMFNVLNGGAHAANNVEYQEFMIRPIGAKSYAQAVKMGLQAYEALWWLLVDGRYTTKGDRVYAPKAGTEDAPRQTDTTGLTNRQAVEAIRANLERVIDPAFLGDEKGFAPNLKSEEEALELLTEAIRAAGYTAGRGKDFDFALDEAASEFFGANVKTGEPTKPGHYHLGGRDLTPDEKIAKMVEWVNRYPIGSIEDGLAEDQLLQHGDPAWQNLTQILGGRIQLVVDDPFVTNPKIFEKGIANGEGNAILIKVNQIGTLTETLSVIKMAQQHGYRPVISHRSGETEDDFIADLVVATATKDGGQIKTGAPFGFHRRGGAVALGEPVTGYDRFAKHARLMDIEEELGKRARFSAPQYGTASASAVAPSEPARPAPSRRRVRNPSARRLLALRRDPNVVKVIPDITKIIRDAPASPEPRVKPVTVDVGERTDGSLAGPDSSSAPTRPIPAAPANDAPMPAPQQVELPPLVYVGSEEVAALFRKPGDIVITVQKGGNFAVASALATEALAAGGVEALSAASRGPNPPPLLKRPDVDLSAARVVVTQEESTSVQIQAIQAAYRKVVGGA